MLRIKKLYKNSNKKVSIEKNNDGRTYVREK
jgi:hypothetical protein